jgi:hypothetical protein
MTGDEFVAGCSAMAPLLAEHAAVGEELRRVPAATIDAVAAADLFRSVVPTSMGGHGLGLAALSQGKPTTRGGGPRVRPGRSAPRPGGSAPTRSP